MKQIAGTRQVLVDFPTPEHSEREGSQTFSTVVCCPFLPMGLIFWGVTDDTLVTRIRSGPMSEGSVSGNGRIPARLFETSRALTELRRLAELGELPGAIDPRAVLEMEALPIGGMLVVEVHGPVRQMVAWGLTYTDGYPFTEVLVEPVTKEGDSYRLGLPSAFRGVVRVHTLAGERDRCRVTAPSVESVTALLQAFAPPSRSY